MSGGITKRIVSACLIAALLLAAGCGAPGGEPAQSGAESEELAQSGAESAAEGSAGAGAGTEEETEKKAEKNGDEKDMIEIAVSGKTYKVKLEDNQAVGAFREMLPLTLDMEELNGNEKYFYLGEALPSAPEKVQRISAGDVMLYGDDCIVLFYESFDTPYSYTRIGHIEEADGLAEAVGSAGVTVGFSASR